MAPSAFQKGNSPVIIHQMSGNTAGVMTNITKGTMVLAGGNNITLSQNGNSVTISGGAGGGAGSINLSAGTTSQNLTNFVLSNSNGLSFGLNGSTITASHNGLTTQTVQTQNMVSVLGSTGNISFANSNGITFGGNASTITASHNGLTSQSNQAVSAANGSYAFQTLSFSNANGISFGTSAGSAITASYTVPAAQTGVSGIEVSNNTYTSGTVTFRNANGISFGSSGANGISASYTVPAAQTGISGIQVSNTTYTSGTITFQNANGISFGSSGANGISASYTVPTQTNQTVGMYFVGNTTGQSSSSTVDARSISFDGAGIVSAGWSNGTVRISATQSNQAFSAGAASSTFQTLSFQDSNGVSFSNNAGAIRVTHGLAGTATAITGGASITANSGGFSFNGTALAGTGTSVSGAASITLNSNGIQFNGNGLAGTGTTFNGANISGSMTVNTAGVNLSLSAGAGGGVTPVASASNGSFSFTTLAFSNANNVTFGTSAGSIITASVAAPGAAAENNAINLLGANTAGNTTATGSTIGWSGVNLTFSGTNASQVVVSAPATSSIVGTGLVSLSTNGSTISIGVPAYTFSGFHPYGDLQMVTLVTSQGTLSFNPMVVPNVQFDRVVFPLNNTNSSNSSGSHTLNFRVGIYTQNGSTLSLLASASSSTGVTHSGTAGSYSLYSGMRLFSIPMTTTLTEGRYWLAFNSNTTSGGANGSYSLFGLTQHNSNFLGHFGSSHNTTYQFTLGQGIYTASTTAMPNSVAFSQIRGSDSQGFRFPIVGFASSTV